MLYRYLRYILVVPLTLLLVALPPSQAGAQEDCGPLYVKNVFGPWDYTDPSNLAHNLPVVEENHFAPRTEQLVDATSVSGFAGVAADLDYTLRTFPNHHRALYAMMRYQLEYPRPVNADYYTIECYFERAIRFKRDDPVVYMLHGIYLQRTNQREAALESYLNALKLQPDLTEAHYNLGLLYTELDEPELAMEQARLAYGRGYPLQGLKNRLVRSGHWQVSAKPETKPEKGTEASD